ncbi:hypothetical protein IFM89_035127 [Coptis chinensis]|uniref:Uncharacterized protein n=1 Tax=Coptis chinensis TaxID=261450 RepID=A0A835ISP8_9MAGN|nr:hypothetical protein IFM89_035127 [Coptis chinensis]
MASAGDDKKISLWHKNGQSLGTVPIAGTESGDNINVLRVFDYSRVSRHLLVTAGDGGSIHLWDTTGRNPKIIAIVGLDKKDDGWILAAGTNNGRVVFYDVRGKPQPITALRAYSNSEIFLLKLVKLHNKIGFILGKMKGEIIVGNNSKRKDLSQELHQKGFTPFPRNIKNVEVVLTRVTENGKETEDNLVVGWTLGTEEVIKVIMNIYCDWHLAH